MKTLQTLALFLAMLTCGPALAASSGAPEDAPAPKTARVRKEARKHFAEGTRLYKRGQYREAIAEFQAAYNLQPHSVVLFNLAQCHEKLGELQEALEAYEQYLKQEPSAPDGANVAAMVANLKQRLSVQRLEIETQPAGAAVSLDGVPGGKTPYAAPHPLGKHAVELSLSGYETVKKQVSLGADAPLRLELVLTPTPTPTPTPTGTRPASPAASSATASSAPRPAIPAPEGARSDLEARTSQDKPRRWTWIAAGTAGVALVGAAVLGSLARANETTLHTGGPRAQPEVDRLYNDARTQAFAANVCYGVAGVAALTGGTLFVVEGRF